MTIQQEAMQMIESMPDESVHFIVALIKKMAPEFRGIETKGRTQDVSKRIGMGKGLINDPEGFDSWDDEIADLFEGKLS